jgi:hypothetical protein
MFFALTLLPRAGMTTEPTGQGRGSHSLTQPDWPYGLSLTVKSRLSLDFHIFGNYTSSSLILAVPVRLFARFGGESGAAGAYR